MSVAGFVMLLKVFIGFGVVGGLVVLWALAKLLRGWEV